MATALRRLFVNLSSKTLQVSDKNGGPFTLPRFTKYETVPLAVSLVEPDLTSGGILKFTRVDISPISLKVSINDDLDTLSPLLVQQTIWTKDEVLNVFSGELEMNTAAMNNFIGVNATVAAYFEIEWSEGTARTKVVIPITIENAVTQIGATGPNPIQEYYTKGETIQQFIPRVGESGGQQTYTSPNGLYQRIIGVGDDGMPIDQIVPV